MEVRPNRNLVGKVILWKLDPRGTSYGSFCWNSKTEKDIKMYGRC